jgi:hypothetical protein
MAEAAFQNTANEFRALTGLPVVDPIRVGVTELADALA